MAGLLFAPPKLEYPQGRVAANGVALPRSDYEDDGIISHDSVPVSRRHDINDRLSIEFNDNGAAWFRNGLLFLFFLCLQGDTFIRIPIKIETGRQAGFYRMNGGDGHAGMDDDE